MSQVDQTRQDISEKMQLATVEMRQGLVDVGQMVQTCFDQIATVLSDADSDAYVQKSYQPLQNALMELQQGQEDIDKRKEKLEMFITNFHQVLRQLNE